MIKYLQALSENQRSNIVALASACYLVAKYFFGLNLTPDQEGALSMLGLAILAFFVGW